ncbi:hypothetical protein [Bradyrhizobium sp. 143]|uniref:hypothetical protein n=1 Tax=unclassified Bradyrhizobium TaxID=2631580 RepID=UPI003209C290
MVHLSAKPTARLAKMFRKNRELIGESLLERPLKQLLLDGDDLQNRLRRIQWYPTLHQMSWLRAPRLRRQLLFGRRGDGINGIIEALRTP